MSLFICVLTTVMTCTQINVQSAQQVDPNVIVQMANPSTPNLVVLEDNSAVLCLEGGC